MKEDSEYKQARERMVEEQFLSRDIRDARVLDAMRRVPRHVFVPEEHRHLAYRDSPLPIGQSQTISQPYIAVLSLVAGEVHTVERHEILARQALACINALDIKNVIIHVGDGTRGWPANAPYDAIIATAAAPKVPNPLLNQLADGGRLVIPVGGRIGQYLEIWSRVGENFDHQRTVAVAFVPLLGKYGWKDDSWDWL